MGAHKELLIKEQERLLANAPMWQLEEQMLQEIESELEGEEYEDYIMMNTPSQKE